MISFLLAMDENRAIGKDNDLPWHLPADLQYFKKLTTGHTIVMGRKTYQSIGRPLPKRINVVITRDQSFTAPGCIVLHDVNEIWKQFNEEDELFIIGGAELFQTLLEKADRLYITLIHEQFDGDTFFPDVKKSEWKLVSKTEGQVDEKNKYPHTFLVYEKR